MTNTWLEEANSMSEINTIKQIYTEVEHILPPIIVQRLRFLDPDQPPKHSGKIWRGRILSTQHNSIFDSRWCFYEIGVGRYGAAPTKQGGVGFVCYSGNKQCGKGAHSAAVFDIMSRFVSSHPQFPTPKRGDKKHAIFTYYSTIPPIEQPVRDLAELILNTFDPLNKLQVANDPNV